MATRPPAAAANAPEKSFRESILHRARRARARIALPEVGDPRILAAACRSQSEGMTECILIGTRSEVQATADRHNLQLPRNLMILAPEPQRLAPELAALRAHKGLDVQQAEKILQNPIAAAAMLVHTGEVDGMVAGAATASAEVLRPALQIVGAATGVSCVSSLFFMLFPNTVRVFADCALNQNPSAEQLAEIARQSAATASAFGIEPVVAMLSYATGESASGSEVAKIIRATRIAKQNLAGCPVFGPIQYDAAVAPAVAARKAAGWDKAGQASVLIFPDLNSGNISYKAVQQTGGIAAVGPVLQGLAAPVNDLSRGATIEDIFLTIAVTAVQAALRADHSS